MTKGQIKFNAIKDEYLAQYERTNGKPVKKLTFENGWVIVTGELGDHKVRPTQFEEMLSVLKERKDFEPQKKPELVAKLVTFTLITRVIVRDNATEEEIVEATKNGIIAKVRNNELLENIEKIEDDKEVPYDSQRDGVSLLFPVS